MKPKTAVAVSGGIDSLVAAYLLQKKGHTVVGLHFITGYETDLVPETDPPATFPCGSQPFAFLEKRARRKLAPMAKRLGIDIDVIDCRKPFQSAVVDYFTQTYQAGKTPNPCLMCNPRIKFGTLLDKALASGADRLATGHYAVVSPDSKGRYHLYKGVDPLKEQSYFLALLTQVQLSMACLPLGRMTKSDVRRLAAEKNLIPAARTESQDICFVKSSRYGAFLDHQRDFAAQPGLIEDMQGRVIGRHPGLHLFTVGQRRGINCPAAEPYYVLRLDAPRNRLVVGWKQDLLSEGCTVDAINWINGSPGTTVPAEVRLRYRHKGVQAKVRPVSGTVAEVMFDMPQSAVTPGQGAVFYQGDRVLGGGWIRDRI